MVAALPHLKNFKNLKNFQNLYYKRPPFVGCF
jgi:hypothetical protein